MQDMLDIFKKHGKDILIIILIIIALGLTYFKFIRKEDTIDTSDSLALVEKEEVKEESITPVLEDVPKNVNVDIKGAVKNPGVYQVNDTAIINDIVKLAGGFNSNAYQNGINLSKKVSDEMVIYVYTKSEINNYKKENNITQEVVQETSCKTPSYTISECVDDKASIIEVGESINSSSNSSNNSIDTQDKEDATGLININTATEEELTKITGIGPSKAKAIISYREENGKFSSIQDILKVSGIGEALFEKIKPFITV